MKTAKINVDVNLDIEGNEPGLCEITIRDDEEEIYSYYGMRFSVLINGKEFDHILYNNWKIIRISFENYFGRTILRLNLEDPTGYYDNIDSGGRSIFGLSDIPRELQKLLEQFKVRSYFGSVNNYRKFVKKYEIKPYG